MKILFCSFVELVNLPLNVVTKLQPKPTKDTAGRLYNSQQSGQPAAARTSAHKLYFFKSPPPESSKAGTRSKPARTKNNADKNGTSTPTKDNSSEVSFIFKRWFQCLLYDDDSSNSTLQLPLAAVNPKGIGVISPPAPALSAREQKAIEKHVQSIKSKKT